MVCQPQEGGTDAVHMHCVVFLKTYFLNLLIRTFHMKLLQDCELQSCMIANIQYLTPYLNDLAGK